MSNPNSTNKYPLLNSRQKPPVIRLRNVIKRYSLGDQNIHALDTVDLTVNAGEFVAIVGPSGSGKSTLMNIIGLLDGPDSGSYELKGRSVAHLCDNEIARLRNTAVGFVFQSFNLLGTLTALENVKMPLIYRGVASREAAEQAQKYLIKVGLKGREHHLPHQLSGGQQQRVAIARALVGKPEIILADEPTGALDSKTSEEIMRLLEELHVEGQTIVLITHNPELALRTDRTLCISDGKLMKRGDHATASNN